MIIYHINCQCTKCFIYMISFNFHSILLKQILLIFPFYNLGNRNLENLWKHLFLGYVTYPWILWNTCHMKDKIGIWTQTLWLPKPTCTSNSTAIRTEICSKLWEQRNSKVHRSAKDWELGPDLRGIHHIKKGKNIQVKGKVIFTMTLISNHVSSFTLATRELRVKFIILFQ